MQTSPFKAVVLLIMHGMPPKDFPPQIKRRFFQLRSSLGDHAPSDKNDELVREVQELDDQMRSWPRNIENDSFSFAAEELRVAMEQRLDVPVIVAFNEFCSPTVDQGFQQARALGSARIVVVTPMMTRGGNHSEEEIPQEIEKARAKYPDVTIDYAWPFANEKMAEFLGSQVLESLAVKDIAK